MAYYSLASLFSWLLVGALYFSFKVTYETLRKEFGSDKLYLDYAAQSSLELYSGMLIITLIFSFAISRKR